MEARRRHEPGRFRQVRRAGVRDLPLEAACWRGVDEWGGRCLAWDRALVVLNESVAARRMGPGLAACAWGWAPPAELWQSRV
ncbi:hypothetical protein Aab01nite_18680 [Paractinoplanes abujensis]|uniref:Uncharacterized protein n=1 Tax=Paractinoplanes abujensis TaxID=882441 RepID=A0A7W7CZ14_9ACTN|nr:hypothetical protein [Actinoplanes abujensis]MBB4697246.1 hypothetical protein [Actinoplanes abujensis]GID18278.1 hypothetical protein Aab01nite_18680 [Actinoplanes abujensis]